MNNQNQGIISTFFLQVSTTMFRVLIILSSVTCLYLTDKVLAQQLSTTPYCIQQHYQPENSCYEKLISINDNFIPQAVTSLSYDPNTKLFTIIFDEHFLDVSKQASMLNVTILKLCHEEALQLTLNDLVCGLSCTTETFPDIKNSVTVECGERDFIDSFLNDNRTIIAFMPNRTEQSCNKLSTVNLVLVNTEDVDECIRETHNCSQNAECIDRKCGYSCQCESGYYIGEDNYTCLGIRIAFEMEEYNICESTGKIKINVSVVSASLEFSTATVLISSENGSARGGVDFIPVMVNITFSPDSLSSPVTIKIIDDSMTETNKTFTLHLRQVSPGVLIETPNATVTILDDDGNVTQTCNTECTLRNLEQRATSLLNDDDDLSNKTRLVLVEELVGELINISKPSRSLMPSSLELIIGSLSTITTILENINSTDKRIIEIFNNLLDQSQSEGWRNVLLDGRVNASEILLHSAERYAMMLATTSNSNSEVQSRPNIVVSSLQYSQSPSSVVQFPMKDDLVNFTRAKQSEASITIPQSLIQERINDAKPLPVAFILFQNLPTVDLVETESVSHVVSAQVGMTGRSSALLHDPVIINFGIKATGNGSSHACVYWNFSQPFGNGSWVSDDVTTKCVSTSNDQTSIMCASTHLTSFAVLVDVTGALGKVSTDVQFALEVVSYVGCAISIVCLLITVVFFLLQGKKLFAKVHYFVHLNLAFTLLLANVVFASSVVPAKANEIACAFVAALLHYLFLSAFCWMLCEGIMLYLLLVVIFGSSSHRIWIFVIIGYLLPLPVVIVTVGIRYQYYGVKSDCGQLLYCWLSTKHGTVYGFVAPVLAIISANVVFLLIALRVLWRSKRQQLKRNKENANTDIMTARAVLLASVVLLPLLGLTWAFGVLNVNENTIVFAWLFTIFNSLQGAFLFFFHVLRSEMVHKTLYAFTLISITVAITLATQYQLITMCSGQIQTKISLRLQTLKGTLRSYTSTTRWANLTSTTRIGSTIHQRNDKHMTENASTYEISNDQMPTNEDDGEGDSTIVTVHDKDQEVASDEHCAAENVTEQESKGQGHIVQCETSRPVIERVLSDGSMIIDMQVNMTPQKVTVLKINQLLRRTRKLLTTSQEIVEETMETNMNSNEQGNISM